jgi:hypothetical protein
MIRVVNDVLLNNLHLYYKMLKSLAIHEELLADSYIMLRREKNHVQWSEQ